MYTDNLASFIFHLHTYGINSIYVYICYSFTYKLFRTGVKKELQEEDIYETLNDLKSSKLGDILETEWKSELLKEKPSFSRALWRVFGKQYIANGVILLFCTTSYMYVCSSLHYHTLVVTFPKILKFI